MNVFFSAAYHGANVRMSWMRYRSPDVNSLSSYTSLSFPAIRIRTTVSTQSSESGSKEQVSFFARSAGSEPPDCSFITLEFCQSVFGRLWRRCDAASSPVITRCHKSSLYLVQGGAKHGKIWVRPGIDGRAVQTW